MRYPNVKLIAAIGNYGQIGDAGKLPWYDRRDLKHFRELTMGGICVVGKTTAKTLPTLEGREVIVWRSFMPIEPFIQKHKDRAIWVCGGAHIYKAWLPYVSISILTHIDYNPKADVYMPWLWRKPKRRYFDQKPIEIAND